MPFTVAQEGGSGEVSPETRKTTNKILANMRGKIQTVEDIKRIVTEEEQAFQKAKLESELKVGYMDGTNFGGVLTIITGLIIAA